MIVIILFAILFIFLLIGFPVAFSLGGISIIIGVLFLDIDFMNIMPLRIFGIMKNYVLISVPLFIFMGNMLDKSGISQKLLHAISMLLARLKGGLLFAILFVGTILAATTGIVGATVVTMGTISLPILLKRNYSKEISTGIICASGTLGQIIPPSVVLILLASTMNLSVGELFISATIPGLSLAFLFGLYLFILGILKPNIYPSIPKEEILIFFKNKNIILEILVSLGLPLIIIFAVLGSILFGIASPTESAGIGAFAALLLAIFGKKLNLKMLKEVMAETTFQTSMVFLILIGSSLFSLVFRKLGGDDELISIINELNLNKDNFLIIVLLFFFILGFFIDFIEIIFIFMPIINPIFITMGINQVWAAILIALILQTSFLTPPFGFSLFYLKGVAPPGVTTLNIYKGVVPFIFIQIVCVAIYYIFPDLVLILSIFWKNNF